MFKHLNTFFLIYSIVFSLLQTPYIKYTVLQSLSYKDHPFWNEKSGFKRRDAFLGGTI